MKLYTRHFSAQIAQTAEAAPIAEINTTPLIDVLLVLIIMLIMTIPVQLHAVILDMPSRQAVSTVPEVMVLQIDARGFVLWDGVELATMDKVNARFTAAASQAVQPEVHIQPATDTPYALVTAVMLMARKAGLQKVGVGG